LLQLTYTPFIWPFVVSQIITTLLAYYAYRRRHLPAAAIFAMLMVALTLWTFCYTMELASSTLAAKIFWASAKYFGAASGPVIWFILALRLTNNDRWLTPPLQLALSTFAVVTCLVVFTNDFHHWYWTSIYIAEGFPETQSTHGFFFWVYAGVTYSLVGTSAFLFFQYYRITPAFYRRQALLMALGGAVPLAGRVLEDFLKIDLFPKVDNIVLLFLLSGILFAIAIFRYGAFHIVHIAHDRVIHNIRAGIIVLDMFGRVVDINPYAKALTHSAASTPIGAPLHTILDGWPKLEVNSDEDQEIAISFDDREQWFYIQRSQIKAENGVPAGYALVLFDITARKHAEQQLAALAQTDPLTGITNRRHFFEQAEAEFARAGRYQRPLAIMMIDIDHFKQINDTYGHLVGDEVIKFVAAECQRHLRVTDIFGRYGGEEFICLLEHGSIEAAYRTAERIRQVIAEAQLDLHQHTIRLTLSIGIATLNEPETTLNELIKYADQALYLAKSSGRNQVRIWETNAP
jgi:diguanylate cyclase (GGDEF)-like protein